MTDVLTKQQTDRMVSQLNDTTTFKRPYMVPSLAADHPKYKANGRYWQGGIWPGTNYMVMLGLYKKGYLKEAREVALSHYAQVFEVYKQTGTFWEYYAPESCEPGFMARKDFVGWTGLAPIAEFIEFILGIKGDYAERQIVWDLQQREAHGIERYPFGPDGMVTLKAAARRNSQEEPRLTVESNIDFRLVVRYGEGKEKIIDVKADR